MIARRRPLSGAEFAGADHVDATRPGNPEEYGGIADVGWPAAKEGNTLSAGGGLGT